MCYGHEKKGDDHQLKNLLIVKQILPVSNCTFARKCIENSMENMHTDVRMERVNIINCNF